MNEMNSKLIPVFESTINEESVQTVNARELHTFLEVKKDFSDWIKAQIERARLVENRDYLRLPQKGEVINQRVTTTVGSRIDYYLTLNSATHVSLMSNTDKGYEVREYFISVEREFRMKKDLLSPAELILRQAQMLVNQERRLAEMDERVKRIECKQQAFEDGIRYFTVIGYVGYKGLPAVNMTQAQKLGKIAKKLSNERSISVDRVKDQRHGYVGSYHETVLDDAYATLLETVD